MSNIQINIHKEIKNKTLLVFTKNGKYISFKGLDIFDHDKKYIKLFENEEIKSFESIISMTIDYIYSNSIILFGKQLSKRTILGMIQKYIYFEDNVNIKKITLIGAEITNDSKVIFVFE